MKVLDLFSGIGGFSLGLERAGMNTVAFCDVDPWCRGVLADNWPSVKIYDDVRQLTWEKMKSDGINRIDLICGGFPCQDISCAGKKAGIEKGARSGLWREFARLVGEIRPGIVVVENTPGVPGGNVGGWLGTVLGDLAALRYNAEWHCIPASAVGAPHRRDRVWIVAYAHKDGRQGAGRIRQREPFNFGEAQIDADDFSHRLADRLSDGLRGREKATGEKVETFEGCGCAGWADPPEMGALVHGLPRRMAGWRRRSVEAIGNAIVPQVAEVIGRSIMEAVA